jgi:hypothetical protein
MDVTLISGFPWRSSIFPVMPMIFPWSPAIYWSVAIFDPAKV